MSFLIFRFIKFIVGLIPKNNQLILVTSWFGQKYADSSMYFYEYLLDNSNYKVCWFTRNKSIYDRLTHEKKPVVLGGTFKGYWMQFRAKVLITSIQVNDFDTQYLSGCILFDLDHGFPLKQIAFEQPDSSEQWKLWQLFLRKDIDYWMTASSKFCIEAVHKNYRIPYDHIALCNKPREDVFFDKQLRVGLNTEVEAIKGGKKAIVWMPTHRLCGNETMPVEELLDLKAIDDLCDKANCVFIIKKHFYHKDEKENLSLYKNIFDLTSSDLDSQVLLYQADVLITDYSSCFIDYLLLDRPIIYYVYDLKKYLETERGLLLNFDELCAGEHVLNKKRLNERLEIITKDWYDSEYEKGRLNLRRLYFDESVDTPITRNKVKEVFDKIILNS